MTPEDLPAYSDLILPVIRAVEKLGGSAQAAEIVEQVLADLDPSEEALAVTFANRPHHSVLIDRIMWARSYAKLIGGLDSPKRAVFLLTPLGRELLALPEEEGQRRTHELNREFRRSRPQRRRANRGRLSPPGRQPTRRLSPNTPMYQAGRVRPTSRGSLLTRRVGGTFFWLGSMPLRPTHSRSS